MTPKPRFAPSALSDDDIELIDAFLPEGALCVLETGAIEESAAVRLAARGLRMTATTIEGDAGTLAACARDFGPAIVVARASTQALPFPDDCFDAVIAGDLTRAVDPAVATAELSRVARERLIAILPRWFDPAFPGLRTLVREEIHQGDAILYVGEKRPLAALRTHRFDAHPGTGAPDWNDPHAATAYEQAAFRAWDHARVGNHDESLREVQTAAAIAYIQGAPFYEDPRLEELLADLAAVIFNGEDAAAKAAIAPRIHGTKPRVGYVVSFLNETGGHLRTLMNLIEHHQDCLDVAVYSTEMYDSAAFGPAMVKRLSELGVPFWTPPPSTGPVERARQLRARLATDGRELAVLFVNPDDVPATLALRERPPFATCCFHHGANTFNLGANAMDHHADYLEGLLAHCTSLRPTEHREFLPLPGPDPLLAGGRTTPGTPRGVPANHVRAAERSFLGLPPGSVVSFTSATSAKLFDGGDPRYFQVLARFLRAAPDVHHLLLVHGPGSYDEWIRDYLAMAPDIAPRIHRIGRVPSLLPLLAAVDLVLDSFPLGGGNVGLETMVSGLPMVTMAAPGPIPMGPHEMIAHAACVARGEEDYLEKALAMARDAALRRNVGAALRARFEERYAPDAVARTWESSYRAIIDARRAVREKDRGSTPFQASIVLTMGADLDRASRCLESIATHTPDAVGFEVVIVADGNADQARELMARLGGDVSAVMLPLRAGASRARNAGAQRASGDVIVFVDAAVLATAGWIEPLLAALRADPELGAVGPGMIDARGCVTSAGLAASGWLLGTAPGFHHRYADQSPDLPGVKRSRELQALYGACIAVRRDAFLAVGGYHPRLGGLPADADLGLRFRRAGLAIRYEPAARVIVASNASVDSGSDARLLRAAHEFRLRERWTGRIASDEVRLYLEDGLVMTRTPAGLQWLPWAVPLSAQPPA